MKMDWVQIIMLLIIGVSAGLLAGLLGMGGAIIIIPALVMLMGYSQQMAQGTTLVMLVLPTGALAAWQYYKAGQADIKTALILSIAFFVSGYIGAKLAVHMPQQILKKAFAILLILVAGKMLFIDK